MAGFRIEGNTSGNVAEVDSNNNIKVNTPATSLQAGFTVVGTQNDAGTITGSRYTSEAEITDDYRFRTGQDNMVLSESFPGSAVNTALWRTTLNVMTNTVVGGFSQLNAGSNLASGSYVIQGTYRHFPIHKQFTTFYEMELQFTSLSVSGNRCEWGAMLCATNAAPTDGAFFRLDSDGTFVCVANYAGAETISSPLSFPTLVGANNTHTFLIYLHSTNATFWIDNIMVAEVSAPSGQASITSSQSLPLTFRCNNVTATSTAQIMKVGNTSVVLGDQASSKPWGHVMTGGGGTALQGQTGGTMGSTAIITNAATTAAAALSNTTPTAQFTGLGGFFNVLPTLAVGTDGILCSYQNPSGTSILPGKTLYITGVVLDGVVSTVLVGNATSVIYAAGIAFGHTSASLATGETVAAKAPRRLALGMQQYAAAAAVGAQGQRLQDDYTCSPIIVQPGEFFQVTLRNFGAVTTTGAITFAVGVTGYWE